MTKTRLFLAAILAIIASGTYAVQSHPTKTTKTSASVASVVVAPQPVLEPVVPRASRSRSVTPTPATVTHVTRPQPVHKAVDKPRHPHVAATRRAQVPASVGGRVYDITMYCDTGSRTASGKWPEPGMVATASRSIPFGTRIVIEGLGTYTVEDRIGHGSDFDLFTHSCSQARIFGRQHKKVSIG